VSQQYSTDPPRRLSAPRIINLVTDPHEREAVSLPHIHSWTACHFNRLISEFQASVVQEPLIPAGAAADHIPQARRNPD